MASATMDPELLDAEPPGEAAEPDDLLSKMIGDEVDSLLAEAEAARQPALAVLEPPLEPAPESAPVAELAPAAEAPPPAEPEAPVDPVAAAATDDAIASQVDDLIDGLVEAEQPATPAAATTPAPATPPATPPAPAAEAGAPDADEAARLKTLETELELDKPPGSLPSPDASAAPPEGAAVSPDAAAATPADGTPVVEAVPRIPLLLRPLILINGPFERFSDPLRSFFGKVAIITLINAIGVLTYVLVFRKHR